MDELKEDRMRPAKLCAVVSSIGALAVLTGCVGKYPGSWQPATTQDVSVVRDYYKIDDVADREVVRRDVTVWFIGPASGYKEFGVRREDGRIEVLDRWSTRAK